LTQGEATILLQTFEQRQTFFFVVPLSNGLDGSELQQRPAARFFGRHTQANILFGLQSHMLTQFFA
jgi:hypothetical protein